MLILGSNGFDMTATRERISELIEDKSGRLLVLPLAREPDSDDRRRLRNSAALAGFIRDNVYVFNEKNPVSLEGEHFDYIAVPGGNTFRLLGQLRKFGLDSFIRQQVSEGAVYLGFSAGACIACPDIEYVRNFDDIVEIKNGDYSALALTDKYVLCHYDFRGPREMRMCRDYIGDEPELITIGEQEIIVL